MSDTTSEAKREEAMKLGAHDVLIGNDDAALAANAGQFDVIVSTVNAPLDWSAYIALLKPEGRLHLEGTVLETIPVAAFDLIMRHKSLSGSPVASPGDTNLMVEFAGHHGIAPTTEHFPISKINEAFDTLKEGSLRYRAILDIS